jgi:hypothetical protein
VLPNPVGYVIVAHAIKVNPDRLEGVAAFSRRITLHQHCIAIFGAVETEHSLEEILRSLREQVKRRSTFDQHHRQFLDRLRHLEWVKSSKLDDRPKSKQSLLANGWMESRSSVAGIEYRITEAGLAVFTRPRLKAVARAAYPTPE